MAIVATRYDRDRLGCSISVEVVDEKRLVTLVAISEMSNIKMYGRLFGAYLVKGEILGLAERGYGLLRLAFKFLLVAGQLLLRDLLWRCLGGLLLIWYWYHLCLFRFLYHF